MVQIWYKVMWLLLEGGIHKNVLSIKNTFVEFERDYNNYSPKIKKKIFNS